MFCVPAAEVRIRCGGSQQDLQNAVWGAVLTREDDIRMPWRSPVSASKRAAAAPTAALAAATRQMLSEEGKARALAQASRARSAPRSPRRARARQQSLASPTLSSRSLRSSARSSAQAARERVAAVSLADYARTGLPGYRPRSVRRNRLGWLVEEGQATRAHLHGWRGLARQAPPLRVGDELAAKPTTPRHTRFLRESGAFVSAGHVSDTTLRCMARRCCLPAEEAAETDDGDDQFTRELAVGRMKDKLEMSRQQIRQDCQVMMLATTTSGRQLLEKMAVITQAHWRGRDVRRQLEQSDEYQKAKMEIEVENRHAAHIRRVKSMVAKRDTLDRTHVVSLLGGPGSGKSAFASRLCEVSETVHVDIGDLLRRAVSGPRAKQHQRATTIRTLLADGHLVPDDIILELLVASLQGGRALGSWPGAPKFSDTDRQVVILENFPATEQQAKLWDEARPRLPKISHVFLLDCPEDEMLTRVLERGKAAESSDGAGKRRDDNEHAWANRMRKWKHCKETVIAARQAAGTCFEVDSMRPLKECAAAGIAKGEELCVFLFLPETGALEEGLPHAASA